MPWQSEIHSDSAPYKVSITRGEWIDEARDHRKIPYKIYLPRDVSGTFPTIIWSHGLGGSRDGAGFLSRFVAEHGFCVIHIQHIGTDTSLWMGKDGHPWDAIRATEITWDMTYNRLLDVPFALNKIEEDVLPDAVQGRIDMSRLGMSGHSFGAYTTQVMAGQIFGEDEQALQNLQQPHFKSALAYSPSHSSLGLLPQDIYGSLKTPTLFMTGTKDDSPLSGKDYTYREKVYEYAGASKKHLLVLEEADHMVFAGSRGQLDSYEKREQHEDIIKLVSLCWWQATLKEDMAAINWLQNGVREWLGSEGYFK